MSVHLREVEELLSDLVRIDSVMRSTPLDGNAGSQVDGRVDDYSAMLGDKRLHVGPAAGKVEPTGSRGVDNHRTDQSLTVANSPRKSIATCLTRRFMP